jgi:hypothetical protein
MLLIPSIAWLLYATLEFSGHGVRGSSLTHIEAVHPSSFKELIAFFTARKESLKEIPYQC